jgi:arginyl-tRNA synthetase
LEKIKDEGEAGYLLAQEVQKQNRNFIEKKLKIKFDNWVSEENLYKKGKVKKIYQWLKKKGLVYEKEGAEWLKISKFGAPKDEVIVRKDGNPTYFLSDIAYHKDKFERGFKKIINIWGADHQGHLPKIKAVAKILGYKGNLDILISQMVRLKGGMRLSKRKGQIITLEELVDEVGLDVARFFYLVKSLNTQMEFDLDLAKEQSQKNPVYYIQYAHTRICGILRKSKVKSQKSKVNYRLLNHPSELELIKQLVKFPEIIEDCAKDYQLQRIPQYALDLATSFHQFYRDCRVLTEKENLKKARLALILATKIVLKNTLNLMGISAPEKM